MVPSISQRNDFLYPWEFGEKEPFFHHLASTDSTMNRAAELAARGCPEGTVITAGEQTAGRGRNGHLWASKQGGLFFTLLERPSFSAADYFRISLAFQIAVARALTKICGKPVRLRWPNDLYAEGKKIAGLLTEFHAEGDRLSWISLGLGVNVNNAPHSDEAANCADLAGRPLSRQEVLLAILAEWESRKKETASPALHRAGELLKGKDLFSLTPEGFHFIMGRVVHE
jgi:BirA family biotin operon repressor/biotin-[acetyl-CoA-carboxylase] ligase